MVYKLYPNIKLFLKVVTIDRIKILNLAFYSLPLKARFYFTCVDVLPA